MDGIKLRRTKLRNEIDGISGNRDRLDHLKDYYQGKTAVIVATGPGFQDHTDVIRDNMNENTILICIKQSLKTFDHLADFHIMNRDNYEPYDYQDPVPIILTTNYPERKEYQRGDIHFYGPNIPGVAHRAVNNWDSIDNDVDTLTFNDANNGPGENMVINSGHILIETAIPLCVHLGVKNIIINGWVGGYDHGIDIDNATRKPSTKDFDFNNQNKIIRISEKMEDYFDRHFGISISRICDSRYRIPLISHDEYIDIVS